MGICICTALTEKLGWEKRRRRHIAKRAGSLRRPSRRRNRSDRIRKERLRTQSSLVAGSTFAISEHYGPTTSRRAASLTIRGISNLGLEYRGWLGGENRIYCSTCC